jgi:hypothetical protein
MSGNGADGFGMIFAVAHPRIEATNVSVRPVGPLSMLAARFRRFRERPFQIVVDVRPRASKSGLAPTGVNARGCASVRGKVLRVRKAVDVAHFQQYYYPKNEADAGKTAPPFKRQRRCEDVSHAVLEIRNLLIQQVKVLQQLMRREAGVRRKVPDPVDQQHLTLLAKQIDYPGDCQPILGQRRVDSIPELGPRAHQHYVRPRQVPLIADLCGRNPDCRKRSCPLQTVQPSHIQLVVLLIIPDDADIRARSPPCRER